MRLLNFAPRVVRTFLLLVSISCSCHAGQKVLFIGNSFTFGHGGTASVPKIFERMAIAGGDGEPLVKMSAVGGKNFEFHENDQGTRAAIGSEPWDYVILQNYSTEPTHLGNLDKHLEFGRALYERVISNRADTEVILYETWARSAKHPLISGISMPDSFASTTEMQDELRAGYRSLAEALNTDHPENLPVLVAPAGDAWLNVGGMLAETNPQFSHLHDIDEYHGNDNGYYLSAAVFYATIYGKSPTGLHLNPAVLSLGLNLTVNPYDLEQAAWETVTGTMKVGFQSQPVSISVGEHQSAKFQVEVRGSRPIEVQWMKDGEPIEGATALTYDLPNAPATMNGALFSVRVSNAISSAVSNTATLQVMAMATDAASDATPASTTASPSKAENPAADGPHEQGNE